MGGGSEELLTKMKIEKATGLVYIPTEVWKCLGEFWGIWLTRLFNKILMIKKIPDEWRRNVVVLYKNKGDIQNYTNHRGIKLMSYTMKLWEKIME